MNFIFIPYIAKYTVKCMRPVIGLKGAEGMKIFQKETYNKILLDLLSVIYKDLNEMSDYLDPNNDELLKDFFAEVNVMVDTLEQNVLVIENEPSNANAIDEIFRAAHTIKGGAATVQMMELSGFTHHIEDLLDAIRAGKVKVTGDVVDVLLRSVDVVKDMIADRTAGGVYDKDVSGIVGELTAFISGNKRSESKSAQKTKKPKSEGKKKKSLHKGQLSAENLEGLTEFDILELKEAAGKKNVYQVKVFFDENNLMNTVGGIQVFAALKEVGNILKTDPDFDELYADNFFPEVTYFISTDAEPPAIENGVMIPDVTLNAEVSLINFEQYGNMSEKPEPAREPEQVEAAAEPESPREEKETEPEVIDEQDEENEPEKAEVAKQEPRKKTQKVTSSILRVESNRIDNLLNLVSETVINKATFNQVSSQFSDDLLEIQNNEIALTEKIRDFLDNLPDQVERAHSKEGIKEFQREVLDQFGDVFNLIHSYGGSIKQTVNKFKTTAQNLGRITSELQEAVMRIRMVPIRQIFSRFPRLVRDLSKSLKKKIKLEIEGEDTELDKSVIEDLLDPLIHCVRNSIDHGLEDPAVRLEKGKSEEGRIFLKASNEGNMILIEISDDGRGIDVNKIREKAISRGIIHPNKSLSDVEAYNLIFEPGFSTAKNVTNISGRGVGLDVVRKQIEKLNGTVSIWTEKGKGSKFTIRLPLTLAIIQGLQVRVGNEIYAIPITSVNESHRIQKDDIKFIDNYEVFNVRDDVISLIRLDKVFRIESDSDKEHLFVVIVGTGDKKVGLVVDALIGEEDVVIKPLKDQYTNSPGIAGATILGDGTVSLIIDVSQLLDLGLQKEREAREKREFGIVQAGG